MTDLVHFDEEGAARMVDVGSKPATLRTAIASGVVSMQPETMLRIKSGQFEKGNVLEIARIAGIMGSKKTSELIPLCHPIRMDSVEIAFDLISDTELSIRATVTATDRTGVEMEALTAVSTAALTVYDMCKSVDRGMQVTNIHLERKTGGKSGDFQRQTP